MLCGVEAPGPSLGVRMPGVVAFSLPLGEAADLRLRARADARTRGLRGLASVGCFKPSLLCKSLMCGGEAPGRELGVRALGVAAFSLPLGDRMLRARALAFALCGGEVLSRALGVRTPGVVAFNDGTGNDGRDFASSMHFPCGCPQSL